VILHSQVQLMLIPMLPQGMQQMQHHQVYPTTTLLHQLLLNSLS
jgi:hypothetical protein